MVNSTYSPVDYDDPSGSEISGAFELIDIFHQQLTVKQLYPQIFLNNLIKDLIYLFKNK